MKKLMFILLLALSACAPKPDDIGQKAEQVVAPKEMGRFALERVQAFNDSEAYYGKRSVYILTDTKTGQQFVGVSGVGIAEIFRSGKSTVEN